jgi:hypothetical protein
MQPEPAPESEPLEGELVVIPETDSGSSMTLFRSDDPKLVVARAVEVANELAQIVRSQKLYARISGRDHVLV